MYSWFKGLFQAAMYQHTQAIILYIQEQLHYGLTASQPVNVDFNYVGVPIHCMSTCVARTGIHVECECQTIPPDTSLHYIIINVTSTVQKIIASCLWLKVTFFSSMSLITFDYISWTSQRKYMGIDELGWIGNQVNLTLLRGGWKELVMHVGQQ